MNVLLEQKSFVCRELTVYVLYISYILVTINAPPSQGQFYILCMLTHSILPAALRVAPGHAFSTRKSWDANTGDCLVLRVHAKERVLAIWAQ